MLARLEDARVARLATVDGAGRPRVVPICFAVAEGRLYTAVDQKPKRTERLARLRDIEERRDAAVLVDHYVDADWSCLWWIRARGRARLLASGAEAERALQLLAAKYPQYRSAPPHGPVIEVALDELTGWQAA